MIRNGIVRTVRQTAGSRSTGVVRKARAAAVERGGGGPAPPPFMRLPVPEKPVNEDRELLWDDGVAPEVTLDFDSQNISYLEGLAMFLSGLGMFGGMLAFMKYVRDPPSIKPCVDRQYPYDGLKQELGGFSYPKK